MLLANGVRVEALLIQTDHDTDHELLALQIAASTTLCYVLITTRVVITYITVMQQQQQHCTAFTLSRSCI
jgi:hypothetical protein